MAPGKCSKPHRNEQVPRQCSTSSVLTVELGKKKKKKTSTRKLKGSAKVKILQLRADIQFRAFSSLKKSSSVFFWGHQVDIQILCVKRECLTTASVGAPHGSWQPAPHRQYLMGNLGDFRHQCHTTCFHHRHTVGGDIHVYIWGLLKPSSSPTASATMRSPLRNLHVYLKRIWTRIHHSLYTQLTIRSTKSYCTPILYQALFWEWGL